MKIEKIEFGSERFLNDKDESYINKVAFETMKSMGDGMDFRVMNAVKNSIVKSYQVFVELDKEDELNEEALSFLINAMTKGTRKPVRGVLIDKRILGLQVFDSLQNQSMMEDAIKHTLDDFSKLNKEYE